MKRKNDLSNVELMAAKKPRAEFDYLVGGECNVPAMTSVKDFILSRVDESIMLSEKIMEPPKKGDLSQRLPKHMRRRQMSHDARRLPRIYHKMVGNKPDKTKRPSRKYKRRPSNILQNFNERQKNKVWLETHVWHAKRFHMKEMWGYKLAEKPTDKGYRACYRAAKEHCLIIDMSYYCCIELRGKLSDVLAGLQKHTSSNCGLNFGAKCYLSGKREGLIPFYHQNSYPFGFIFDIKFIWKASEEDNKILWLWVHPSAHDEVLNALCQTFKLVEAIKETTRTEYENKEMVKLQHKNLESLKTFSSKESNVEVILLKNTLNRYHLAGPIAHCVISEAFKLVKPEENQTVEDVPWWKSYFKDRMDNYNDQKQFLEAVKHNCLFVPSSFVVSLIVQDPRLFIPEKRSKSMGEPNEIPANVNPSDSTLHKSPIWDSVIRNTVSNTKRSTAEINKARSYNLVGGCEIDPKISTEMHLNSGIPVILIFNSNKFNSWDVISPAGWGMPIWQSFIMRGARAGGMNELSCYKLEQSIICDTLAPDCTAGQQFSELKCRTLKEKYFKLPPKKRVNFIKLGVQTPFSNPWKLLVNNWCEKQLGLSEVCSKFYVLRNKDVLLMLQDLIVQLKKREQNVIDLLQFNFENYQHCLVPVSVCTRGKGIPEQFSILCALNNCDYENFNNLPVEPLHKDNNKKLRKELREEHKKCLRSSRRRRKKGIEEEDKGDDYKEQIEQLWLPDNTSHNLITFNSRMIIGFVINGSPSLSLGYGRGLAYVSLLGLLHVFKMSEINKKHSVVLFRNNNSRQYRLADINIIQ